MKALADRFAQAYAVRMHERVRREFWRYTPDEALSGDELIAGKYRGIRPAPGYPAQPDHTEKATLFPAAAGGGAGGREADGELRDVARVVGVGLYFAHPDAHYFGVAKVERDQVADYAARKAMSVDEVERWLAPILNYDPVGMGRAAA